MTKYSVEAAKSISEWGQKAAACNGSAQCLDDCAKELRKSLDSIFPYSKNIEFADGLKLSLKMKRIQNTQDVDKWLYKTSSLRL